MPLAYSLGAFFATALTLVALRPVAAKVGLLDIPGGRKTHLSATPLVGGLGIFAGVLIASLFLPEVVQKFSPLLSLAALIVFIGVIDDAKDLKPSLRMTGHSLVALAMAVVAGIQLTEFGDIFYIGNIQAGWLSIPITVFATVGVINAINMSDGIDGLSGGLVIVTLGSIAILALASGSLVTVSFISLLIFSIAAFLTMNFRRPWNRKALVYLGDAGSTMLGFVLAWLLIECSQGSEALFSPVYALWFMAIPLFDTVNLLVKRPMRGESPFHPGTDHIHHNLLRRGFSPAQVVLILLTTSTLLAVTGLLGHFYAASDALMFQIFISLFAFYFLLEEKIAKSISQ